jgi:hypothetical protein
MGGDDSTYEVGIHSFKLVALFDSDFASSQYTVDQSDSSLYDRSGLLKDALGFL